MLSADLKAIGQKEHLWKTSQCFSWMCTFSMARVMKTTPQWMHLGDAQRKSRITATVLIPTHTQSGADGGKHQATAGPCLFSSTAIWKSKGGTQYRNSQAGQVSQLDL